MVAGVGCDIHAVLGHYPHGAGVEAVNFYAGAVHRRPLAQRLRQVAVQQLAAAGVAGAQHQNIFLVGHKASEKQLAGSVLW